MGSIIVPVVAGIVVGVLLIAVVSYTFRPYYARPDDEVWNYVNSLPEAQAFREKFQNVGGGIWREPHFGTSYEFHVTLAASNEIQKGSDQPYTRTLALTFHMGYSGVKFMFMTCGPLSAVNTDVTVERILASGDCLEP